MESQDRLAPLGRALFGLGILLVVLRGLTQTARIPGLPSFWYQNQSLWIAIGLGMVAMGWKILWNQPKATSTGWQPAISGCRFKSAIIYVGEGCHLCEQAIELLESYRRWLPKADVIAIQSDPQLVERFGTCVPVVVIDGKIRFRGKVNEVLLQRLIEGTQPIGH